MPPNWPRRAGPSHNKIPTIAVTPMDTNTGIPRNTSTSSTLKKTASIAPILIFYDTSFLFQSFYRYLSLPENKSRMMKTSVKSIIIEPTTIAEYEISNGNLKLYGAIALNSMARWQSRMPP